MTIMTVGPPVRVRRRNSDRSRRGGGGQGPSLRNHQGLGNVIPFPSAVTPPDGRICRRERLGGLLNFYERKAA